jgi:dienelactone hydrolase
MRNQRIAVVGNCVGARAALEVAANERDCVGAVCILPALAPPGLSARAGSRLANTRLGSVLLRSGKVRRVIRTAGPSLGDPIDPDLLRALPGALRAGRVLFLYGERDRRTEPARAAVERSLAKSPEPERARCEFRSIPDISLEGFDQPESRSLTTEAVESFLVERFDEADSWNRSKSAITS